jgi:hypothetical protein
MKPTKFFLFLLFLLLLTLSLSACSRNQTVCTPEVGTPQTPIPLADLIAATPPAAPAAPFTVEIGGKQIEVNKLVDYPICNDDWSGVVYVSCEAQVAEAALDAEKNPLFFKGCNLKIAPNTIVYVAAHNDAAYYKGCSCHTGEDPIP